jgi:SAM-dependent methyltransferase
MNYGYVPDHHARPRPLAPEDEPDRLCIQLYDVVASAAELTGKRVLEVGSGRGGGASFVKRCHGPASVTGVDFAMRAVEFCRKRHVLDGLQFECGSAEALPFPAESFDIVLNVESSHCYGSFPAFLKEVDRVLRPAGAFLYADLRDAKSAGAWEADLAASGMRITRQVDITSNVVAALDADSDRKSRLIERLLWEPLVPSFKDFAGIRGSAVCEGFRNRTLVYRMYKLEK